MTLVSTNFSSSLSSLPFAVAALMFPLQAAPEDAKKKVKSSSKKSSSKESQSPKKEDATAEKDDEALLDDTSGASLPLFQISTMKVLSD